VLGCCRCGLPAPIRDDVEPPADNDRDTIVALIPFGG
jgi:hypothetical protein